MAIVCVNCETADEIEGKLDKKVFRVAVFGSARTKPGQPAYDEVVELGSRIEKIGADVITGGGPGMMEAANVGHHREDLKDGKRDLHSIGIGIELPFEQHYNSAVDITEDNEKFSTRLDTFMRLSNAVVITQGGIGTNLELFYTWQLIQVGHTCKMPIILFGHMWEELMDWMKKYQVDQGLVSPEDLDVIHVAHTVDEVMQILQDTQDAFESDDYSGCVNWDKYKK